MVSFAAATSTTSSVDSTMKRATSRYDAPRNTIGAPCRRPSVETAVQTRAGRRLERLVTGGVWFCAHAGASRAGRVTQATKTAPVSATATTMRQRSPSFPCWGMSQNAHSSAHGQASFGWYSASGAMRRVK